MDVLKAIEMLKPCETCERIRYPEKFCNKCKHNVEWQDNYRRDRNIEHLVAVASNEKH